ncbi:hypothetical protein SISNIDRAFT_490383 [Sistotremastrum niveocremeum HHB9708]|nr:hypothetical protein SISNIDRAFT_490383 [Sistotremastrum niveocremeum HHB9708]
MSTAQSVLSTEQSLFPLVKHLYLETPVEIDTGLLSHCTSLQDIAVVGLGSDNWEGPPPTGYNDNTFWSGDIYPSHVTVFDAECGIVQIYGLPTPSILTKCTHLALEFVWIDFPTFSSLIERLPSVTHLGIYSTSLQFAEVDKLGEFCKKHASLRMIVVAASLGRWGSDAPDVELPKDKPSKYEAIDNRVAFIKLVNHFKKGTSRACWEANARGRRGIWYHGRARLEQLGRI